MFLHFGHLSFIRFWGFKHGMYLLENIADKQMAKTAYWLAQAIPSLDN